MESSLFVQQASPENEELGYQYEPLGDFEYYYAEEEEFDDEELETSNTGYQGLDLSDINTYRDVVTDLHWAGRKVKQILNELTVVHGVTFK